MGAEFAATNDDRDIFQLLQKGLKESNQQKDAEHISPAGEINPLNMSNHSRFSIKTNVGMRVPSPGILYSRKCAYKPSLG